MLICIEELKRPTFVPCLGRCICSRSVWNICSSIPPVISTQITGKVWSKHIIHLDHDLYFKILLVPIFEKKCNVYTICFLTLLLEQTVWGSCIHTHLVLYWQLHESICLSLSKQMKIQIQTWWWEIGKASLCIVWLLCSMHTFVYFDFPRLKIENWMCSLLLLVFSAWNYDVFYKVING